MGGIFREILRPRAVRVHLNGNPDILLGRKRPMRNQFTSFYVERAEIHTAWAFEVLIMVHWLHSLTMGDAGVFLSLITAAALLLPAYPQHVG